MLDFIIENLLYLITLVILLGFDGVLVYKIAIELNE